jgi:flagellar biosynthesis protein FlhB
MAALRERGIAQMRERFERARREGDLPSSTDVAALTLFLVSMMNGLAVQASSGHGRDALNSAVDLALKAWPSGATTASFVSPTA